MIIEYQRPELHPKQAAFVDDPSRFTWIEAGTKAGKTIACIIWLHEEIIKCTNRNANFWWIAPYKSTAKIAFTRWWNFIPEVLKPSFKKNETDRSITYPNGHVVRFQSAENPDTLYGEDVMAVVLDEASRMRFEAYHAVVSVLTATNGRAKIIGNVEDTGKWFHRLSVTAKERGEGYHKLISADNPYLSEGVIEHAKQTLPEQIFNALYLAIPTDEYASFRIINTQDIEEVKASSIEDRNPHFAAIDVGLGAPDKTTIWCANSKFQCWREASFSIYDTDRQYDLIFPIVNRINIIDGRVAIDRTAIGQGLSDRLVSSFDCMVPINFGSSPSNKAKFFNLRAEMYWTARNLLRNKLIEVVPTDELYEDVESTFYIPEHNSIRIEPKEDIKSRLGRSPDDLDAFVMLCQIMNPSRAEPGILWLN